MKTKISKHKLIGQCSIEVTLGLLVVFLLLAASARLFIWLNTTMAARQQAFENTRDNTFEWYNQQQDQNATIAQARNSEGGFIKFYTPKPVDLVGSGN